MNDQPVKVTQEELKAQAHRCWSQPCSRRAWLRDWTGWIACLPHWYSSYRWGGGKRGIREFYFRLKTTEII